MSNYKIKAKAIDSRFSVWVNASAGTGKTKILIDRVLRLLLEGKKNILCLTFTNAAANEMEDRVYNILSYWTICSNTELVVSLNQLFANTDMISDCYLSKAKKLFSELENINLVIQTIHAFCYKLISEFPAESGITYARTLDECKELHYRIFNEILNDKTVQNNITAIAAEVDEDQLRSLLYTLCEKRPINNFDYIKEKLSAPDSVHTVSGKIIEDIKNLAVILNNGGKRDQSYYKIIYDWYSDVSENDIKEIAKVFIKLETCDKKNISSIITKDTLEKFPEAKLLITNIQDAVLNHIRDTDAYQIFERTKNLLIIFSAYSCAYNREKSKLALLDYNDIINLAIDLISNENYRDWVLFYLDQKIDHILVDEAQDNSISQWKIITSLCEEFFTSHDEKKRTLFVVGDIKQSIYRFQGANPILFHYMQEYFYKKTNGRDWISCQLETSFRSVPEILMFVDRIFDSFYNEISFNSEKINHVPYREHDQGYIEIWPLLQKCKEKSSQQALIPHAVQKEIYVADRLLAQTIANKIYNWLNEGRILVAKDRHIEPQDIIILVRQRSALIDHIISAFKKSNIPITGRDYFKIMDYIAIQDLIALAEFLLLPENDFALACILKSPLFNFTEDDLFNIAYDRKDLSLWKRLKDYSERIYSELNNMINLSRTQSPLALFSHVVYVSKKKFASRLGIDTLEVIDEFMSLLSKFEYDNTAPSLQLFVQWIKENNPEVKNDMKSGGNAVRIMTIHKSKGLQAPIVFLVDTNTVPKNNEHIIFDEEGAPFWCKKNNNIYCDQLKSEKRIEDYNEYLRLLYVAITRAEDELYILGKEPAQKNSWYELINIHGAPYEQKRVTLYPMFEQPVEISCINSSYPHIYRERDSNSLPEK